MGLCAAAAILGACARTVVRNSLDTSYDPSDLVLDAAFWHKLPERSAVTNDEGLHGLLVVALNDDPTRSYDERVALCRQKNLVPQDFSEPFNATMTRGTLAYALAAYLDIKGGVIMQLAGNSGRYATRELTYIGVLPPGSTDNQAISGLDYVGVISKAQDYMAVRGTGYEPLQKDR